MGTPLHIVHRDVSPQNIMVATDGCARLLDFGVAKASVAAHVTRKGTFKGKLGYSSPEQIRGEANKQSDIYSLGVVLWELLVGHRLHGKNQGEAELIAEIMNGTLPTVTEALAEEKSWIGSYRWSQLEALEPIICKALDVHHRRRWASAADMEEAITAAVPLATAADVAAWLRAVGKDFLEARENMIAEEEASWRRTLAMTEQAVKLPTEAVPVVVPVQPSTGVATEPEGVPILTNTWLRRGPTAIIAALVVVLALTIAFLMRDLDSAEQKQAAPAALASEPAPAQLASQPVPARTTSPPARARSAPAAAAHASAPPMAAAPSRVPSDIPATKMTLPDARDEREDLLEDSIEPSRTTSSAKRTAAKPPSRPRAAKSPPPKPPPPARTQAPAPPPKPATASDCSTPFYYEGNKKIFKPGCL
jgi:serine/threonine-protein kinase